MDNILEAIKQAIEWYFSSPLPKDSAMAIYKSLNDILLPLIYEYITLIFG